MANPCYGGVQACRLRVARLDAGGVPDTGADNLYVTDSLIQIQSTPEIEAGDEFTQKNGCGDICASFKGVDHIKRVTLALTLCQLDAELLEMLTGGSVLTSGGDTVGYAMPSSTDSPAPVSVEAWSKAWDGSQQAVDGSDALYWRFVFPSTTWVLGQHTLANGIMTIPLTGTGTENSGFGTGPGGDLPASIPGPEAYLLDTDLPDAECGYQTLVIAGS